MRTSILLCLMLLALPIFPQAQSQMPYSVGLWLMDGYGNVLTRTTSETEFVVHLPGGVEMEMVRIPAGSFMMGTTDGPDWSPCYPCEQPVHEVNIDYDFFIGKSEVTQGQWLAVMDSWPGDLPNHTNGWGDYYPAYNISWDDCQEFVAALTRMGLGTFRLPSEAEWEYACRAGTTTRFYFGNSDGCGPEYQICEAGTLPGLRTDYMWYGGHPGGSEPTGGKIPNAFGLYDMSGNVEEWCQDYWHDSYIGAPTDGSAWESADHSSGLRVYRGGDCREFAKYCRSGSHRGDYHNTRHYLIGMRVVLEGIGFVPVLSVDPTLFNFGSGQNELTFEISNAAPARLRWTISESETWLRCESAQGNTYGDGTYSGIEDETVKMIVDRTGLTDGEYTGAITVTSNGGDETIEVRMTVGQSPPEMTIVLPGDLPMEMVRIPAGSFMMGSDDPNWSYPKEQPVHEVNIDYDFYMGKYEVTQAQWLAVTGSWPGIEPSSDLGLGEDYPAYFISWDDCQIFIDILNQLGQGVFRLPSEAEWEYACRAGSTTRFHFGDSNCISMECCFCNLGDFAWWCANDSPHGSKPVGGKLPNAFGLYDMPGSVWELCQDNWHTDYNGAPTNGSAWESPPSTIRVIRGGSWDHYAMYCRSAFRVSGGGRLNSLGFRVVRESDGPLLPPSQPSSRLQVDPSVLEIDDSQSQVSFDINVTGEDTLSWTLSESVSWLWCDSSQGETESGQPFSGTGDETVTVIIDRTGLSESLYPGDIIVTSSNHRSEVVDVRMTVGQPEDEIIIDLPGLPSDATPLIMVPIPAGSFLMGRYPGEQDSEEEEDPQHEVTIGYDFYMGKYEVTKAQWQAVTGTMPSIGHFDIDHPDSPAGYNRRWKDFKGLDGFLAKINALGQGTFRLPSEAEWEYVCRAGTTTRFYWGDDPDYSQIGDYAWYRDNTAAIGNFSPQVVGLKLPNAWGLYDMLGNVTELCEDDWRGDDYTNAPINGLPDVGIPIRSQIRIKRGGYWYNPAAYCRIATRDRHASQGIRLVWIP